MASTKIINIKQIYVWTNGDLNGSGQALIINKNKYPTWYDILNFITTTLDPPFGIVRKLINLKSSKIVLSFAALQTNGKYVAVGTEKIIFPIHGYNSNEQPAMQEAVASRHSTFFVMPNGKTDNPCQVVTPYPAIKSWDQILKLIASKLDIKQTIRLMVSNNGELLKTPKSLENGKLYIAVPADDQFVPLDYSKAFKRFLSVVELKQLLETRPDTIKNNPIVYTMFRECKKEVECKEAVAPSEMCIKTRVDGVLHCHANNKRLVEKESARQLFEGAISKNYKNASTEVEPKRKPTSKISGCIPLSCGGKKKPKNLEPKYKKEPIYERKTPPSILFYSEKNPEVMEQKYQRESEKTKPPSKLVYIEKDISAPIIIHEDHRKDNQIQTEAISINRPLVSINTQTKEDQIITKKISEISEKKVEPEKVYVKHVGITVTRDVGTQTENSTADKQCQTEQILEAQYSKPSNGSVTKPSVRTIVLPRSSPALNPPEEIEPPVIVIAPPPVHHKPREEIKPGPVKIFKECECQTLDDNQQRIARCTTESLQNIDPQEIERIPYVSCPFVRSRKRQGTEPGKL